MLPDKNVRASIVAIHLTSREQALRDFDVEVLATATRGFSGAEIEQAVVAAFYAAHGKKEALETQHVLNEIELTRPLSVVMHEQIEALRQWADGRTVPCD